MAIGIRHIAENYPESRAECIAALAAQLERLNAAEPVFNGAVICELKDLNAIETLPIIERAFAANVVDETIGGGWPDIQYKFGVGPEPSKEYQEAQRQKFMQKYNLPRIAELGTRGGDSPLARAEEHRKKAKKAKKRKK